MQGSRLGLGLASSFPLEATGLHRSSWERAEVISLTTFSPCVSSTVWGSERGDCCLL